MDYLHHWFGDVNKTLLLNYEKQTSNDFLSYYQVSMYSKI